MFGTFPVLLLARRLAGAPPIERTIGRRIAAGIALNLAAVLALFILSLTPILLLTILFYETLCSIHLARFGQKRASFAIAAAVGAWIVASFGSCLLYMAKVLK